MLAPTVATCPVDGPGCLALGHVRIADVLTTAWPAPLNARFSRPALAGLRRLVLLPAAGRNRTVRPVRL